MDCVSDSNILINPMYEIVYNVNKLLATEIDPNNERGNKFARGIEVVCAPYNKFVKKMGILILNFHLS